MKSAIVARSKSSPSPDMASPTMLSAQPFRAASAVVLASWAAVRPAILNPNVYWAQVFNALIQTPPWADTSPANLTIPGISTSTISATKTIIAA